MSPERKPTEVLKPVAKTIDYKNIERFKRLHCAFYNECMNEADEKNWRNFACHSCEAYQALDAEQRVQDLFALLAAREATRNSAEVGHAGRKRGVRPGADAKVRVRQPKPVLIIMITPPVPLAPPLPRPRLEATGTGDRKLLPDSSTSFPPE